jgi:hypothetical protein
MIWRLFPFVLAAILVAAVLVSDLWACRSGHIAKGRLTGEDRKEKFLSGSEISAMLDGPGTMRSSSPEKAQMMKNLHPHLFEERALGIMYPKESPELKKLPPLATPKLSP